MRDSVALAQKNLELLALVHQRECKRISITLVTRCTYRQTAMPLQELAKSIEVLFIACPPVRIDLCDILDHTFRASTIVQCVRSEFDDLGQAMLVADRL